MVGLSTHPSQAGGCAPSVSIALTGKRASTAHAGSARVSISEVVDRPQLEGELLAPQCRWNLYERLRLLEHLERLLIKYFVTGARFAVEPGHAAIGADHHPHHYIAFPVVVDCHARIA